MRKVWVVEWRDKYKDFAWHPLDSHSYRTASWSSMRNWRVKYPKDTFRTVAYVPAEAK